MRIFIVIFLVVILLLATTFAIYDKPVPKDKPYVYKKVLYLNLKDIPLNQIVKIEFIRDPVVYVIIHYKTGMYSLPLKEYLKVRENLWYWELFA